MGDNEKFLVLPTPPPYCPSLKAVCDEMKEKLMRELGGKPHKVQYELPNCKVSYKDGMIVVDELTELPKDDFKHLTEKTAKAFEKSCNDYLETLSEVSKSLNPCLERLIEHFGKTSKRKARKYYKPKFTL